MDRMLVVFLDERNFDQGGFTPKDMEKTVNGALTPFYSFAEEVRHFGCNCEFVTCLRNAEALLAEQHFDVVIFDLDVIDGDACHRFSLLDGSAASFFSRADIDDGCWWFPANIVRKESLEARFKRSRDRVAVLEELINQSRTR